MRSSTTKRKELSDEEIREIQRRVIREADVGKVEEDPTQGYKTKLNSDVKYNLPKEKQYNPYAETYVKKKYSEAYGKNMKIPKSRLKHLVEGNVKPIKKGDVAKGSYYNGNAYNIGNEIADKERQAQREAMLIDSGAVRPDYYHPSPFLQNVEMTRKKK